MQAGVEVGDVLDELCGTPVHGTTHGKVSTHPHSLPPTHKSVIVFVRTVETDPGD